MPYKNPQKRQRWRTEVEFDGTTIRYRTEPRVRLLCQCGQYTDTVDELPRHTFQVHGRDATKQERTPL